MLKIKDLFASANGKPILKGFSLEAKKGEIHAIMGPNGAGKSTLAKVLAGHPLYEVESGEIWLNEVNILELDPEERAAAGLFMSFQYPLEIPGITNIEFLRLSYQAVKKEMIAEDEFRKKLQPIMKQMNVTEAFLERDLNDGFSGGEKKRNEIVQMLTLDPLCAILDETDSGLDIDALRIVSEGVNHYMNDEKILLVITHYQRLLDYIPPDFVHVMVDGKIIKTGNKELALELEETGYVSC